MNSDSLEKYEGSIFICGFMASGKSTIGRTLAKKLDWEFYDLDLVIEQKEGKIIRDIFDAQGESYFRKKEWEYLLEITQKYEGVVSLGGGALHNQEVVDHLKLNGILLFVDTPLEQITDRVLDSNERPILFDETGKIKSKETLFAELKALYLERNKFYKQAHISINTSLFTSVEKMVESAIEKIIRHV